MNSTTTDFEEWLDSLGFNDSSPTPSVQSELATVANGDLPPEPLAEEAARNIPAHTFDVSTVQDVNVQSVSFSEEDIDTLLADNGFSQPQYDEAEEIHDGSDDESVEEEESEEEETYERDLDAEEDNDWEERLGSGELSPIEVTTTTVPSASPEGQPSPSLLISENSPTISIDDSTSRFSGTEWYDEMTTKTIMIAGCGGIGSNLAYQIARLKPYSLVLYDDDRVELANMSGQLFKRSDVGSTKVQAVHDMLIRYTNMYNIRAIPNKFYPETAATDIMLCGFDSMEARKTYYNAWKRHVNSLPQDRRKDCFYQDGRLTIDTLQVFCLTGEDQYNMERYEREFLFDDSQADSEVCSQKQTTYLACMIGSIMTNLFINWVANSLDPIIPYKLPFFTQYEAQHMIFKTEE